MEKPAELTKKNPLDGIINVEKAKAIRETLKKYGNVVKEFFGDKEHERNVVIFLVLLTCSILGYTIITFVLQTQALTKETTNLEKIDKYNIQVLKDNPKLKNIANNATTIGDLLKANENIKAETKRYEEHKKELQSSYTNFLQYFLVPKLNIRKEAYTDKINLNLVGANFLEQNPFNDINLYQKWSNFFGSTEKNQVNEIDGLNIGDITETEYGLYSIKLSFSFVTPSKNALLFLADKISISSDKENISLLGEFVYYLRQQIKNDKQAEITKIGQDVNNKDISTDVDKIIGKTLYQWVVNNENSTLIDDKTINKTIKNLMECGTESEAECFYKFRDKYRNVAELAYTIGDTSNTNKTDDLKAFFKNMPPLMTVQSFTFNEIKSDEVLDPSIKYEGKADIQIYGQNIATNEIQEIAKALNKKCFGTDEELSPSLAMGIITKGTPVQTPVTTEKDGNYTSISRTTDLKTILENIDKEYTTANNYKKTIRLFEVYRMLNEGGFCTTL